MKTPKLSLNDIALELYLEAPKYGLWRGGVEIVTLLDLERASKRSRANSYRSIGKFHQKWVAELEIHNNCGDFVFPFGSTVAGDVLLKSPWSRRLERCPDYIYTACEIWTDRETSWGCRREWLRFFRRHREAVRQQWMTEQERATLNALPNPVTIYRGYNRPHGRLGLSWTLSKEVARKIPTCRRRGECNPWVITARVKPCAVIAYLDEGTGEQEIIIRPCDARVIADEPASVASICGTSL